MGTSVWIIVGVVVIGIIIWRLMIPSLSGVIAKAKSSGDIAPIVEVIDKLKVSARPTAYNHAIRRIWDDYERDLAVVLIKDLAKKHSDSLIAQYWLKQVMQVEPELAREHLSKEFLEQYYQPEVAAQCGSAG